MSVGFTPPKLFTTWDKHGLQPQQQSATLKSNSQLLKEKNFLRSAKQEGLVHELTEKDLIENSRNVVDKQPSYPGDARLIKLSNKRLQEVNLIDICERLTICILNNNFLKNVKALKWCTNLNFLDLHSNQIVHIPNAKFWAALTNLSAVYLHDNGFYKLEELKYLHHAPVLSNLTLYDTPVSLKKNYRHCVVNAVWSLKALDYAVVSDEEIIEDANFPAQYKAMQPHLKFQSLYFNQKQSTKFSYKEMLLLIRKEAAVINCIQAKWCPVLILQKVIRGFLVRLRFQYIMDTRLWAAVSIQRYYRLYKGYTNPPPTSPISYYNDVLQQSLSSLMKFDYETYLKLRRSRHQSTTSFKSEKSTVHSLRQKENSRHSNLKNARKRISIDLEKLEGKATEILKNQNFVSAPPVNKIPPKKEDSEMANATMVSEMTTKNSRGMSSKNATGSHVKTRLKVGKYFTQYQFLGEQINPRVEIDECDEFKLTIQQPYAMKHDPLEEIIVRTVEGADDIRRSIKLIDARMRSVPLPVIHKHQAKTADQKFYLKTQGSMGLSCFQTVNKAYKDRKSSEELLKRIRKVNKMKNVEKKSKHLVSRYKSNYRQNALNKKQDERLSVLDAIASKQQAETAFLDNIYVKRTADKERSESVRRNYQFVVEFRCQNASVEKALANHDRNASKEEVIERNTRHVKEMKTDLDHKRELILEYMSDLKLTRKSDTLSMKEGLRRMLDEKAAERRNELARFLKNIEEKNIRNYSTPTLLPLKEMPPLHELLHDIVNDKNLEGWSA